MWASVPAPLTPAPLSLQVEITWTEVVQPFVSQHSQHFGGAEMNWRRRFDWATAIVAAYSFELGDDKFQVNQLAAGVPLQCSATNVHISWIVGRLLLHLGFQLG